MTFSEDDCIAANQVWLLQALDVMAINLPPKHIFPEVFAFSKAAIENASPATRHGAVLALLMVTEGCANAVRKKLHDVLQVRCCCCAANMARMHAAFCVCNEDAKM